MKLHTPILSIRLALTVLSTQGWATETETVYLFSLDLSPIVQGWGQPQADKAVTEKPMSIGGKRFERRLGTHTDSLGRLQLNGGSERFLASVGVDDAATSDLLLRRGGHSMAAGLSLAPPTWTPFERALTDWPAAPRA